MLTFCSTLLEALVRKGSGSCMSFLNQTKLRSFSTHQKPSEVKKQKTKLSAQLEAKCIRNCVG